MKRWIAIGGVVSALVLAWFGLRGRLSAQEAGAGVQVLKGFAINGRLATRGVVLRKADGRIADDGSGTKTWVEYDDTGRKYDLGNQSFKQDASLTVRSLAQYCAEQNPFTTNPQQNAAVEQARTTCQTSYPGVRSVLADQKVPSERAYMSTRLIAYETDFFTIDPREVSANLVNPSCVLDESKLPAGTNIELARARNFVNCKPKSMSVDQKLRVWAPIERAEIEWVNQAVYRKTQTDREGYFVLTYTPRVNEYATFDINGVVSFAAFDPRTGSPRKFFVTASAVTGYIYEPGQAYLGLTPLPNYSTDPAIASGTLFANIPLEAAVLTLPMQMVNPGSSAPAIELTGYPGSTVYNHQSVNDHLGLLSTIATPELRDTEIYVYRVSDGKLVGSRWGMTDSEIPSCDGKACLAPSVLMRGPASLYTNHAPARFNPTANLPPLMDASGKIISPGKFGIELSYNHGLSGGQIPFLREGDQVKVIAINRATGYMGSKLMQMVKSSNGTMAFDGAGTLTLAPPNLKVTVTRQTQIKQGATRTKPNEPISYVIGFEGSGLDTDELIQIETEWNDSDGSPLPEDLPGFTGRLAMTVPAAGPGSEVVSVDGGLVQLRSPGGQAAPSREDTPAEEDRSGFFPIKPGRNPEIVHLPQGTLSRGHFYVHVDAQPLTRNVDFTGSPPPAGPSFSLSEICYSTCIEDGVDRCGVGTNGRAGWTCFPRPDGRGAGEGALAQRPANYVPFLTPKYNQTETERLKRTAGGADVKPVYDWFYRPEMQFSLFSLEMQGVVLRNTDGSSRDVLPIEQPVNLYSADSLVRVLYKLDAPSTPALEDVDGTPRKLVFAIGDEFEQTTFGQDDTLAISDPRLASKLTPHDFLALRLLQQGDEGNVLWEYAFQDLRVYLTRDSDDAAVSNIPKGKSHARPRLQPENPELAAQVHWTLIDVDDGVKIEIGETSGQITVPEESGDGHVIIEAKINEQLFTRVRLFVGCECQECKKPGGCLQRVGSVDLTFSLGSSEDELSGGQLYVKNDTLGADAYKRKSVLMSTTEVATEAVGDAAGLRQVLAPGTFVQVEDLDPNGYELRFYPPSVRTSDEKDPNTHLYPVALPDGSNPLVGAFVVWRVTDPGDSPQGLKRLRVTELRNDGASEKHSDYAYDAAAGSWTLSQADGLRNEQRVQQVQSGRRVVRTTVSDATHGVASAVEQTFQTFLWGEELVSEVQDPDGERLTTTIAYYDNDDDVGSYRQIRHRVEPDGSWVRYSYDDHRRVLTETRPWLDGPADPATALAADARVIQYGYAPVDAQDVANALPGGGSEQDPGFSRPRVVAERVQGKLVSLIYTSVQQQSDGLTEITERCPTASSSFGDGTCLRTVTRYYPALLDAATNGKLREVVHPDGRLDSYTYEHGLWSGSAFTTGDGRAVRTTVTHGTTASPAGVPYKTTREVSIADELGHSVRDESYVYDGGYALVSWSTRQYDAEGHLTLTTRSTGEQERASWGCCAVESTTDSRGITTTYDRDDLQRVRSATRAGITTTYTYDAQGRELRAERTGGGLSLASTKQYDGLGRVKLSKDESGLETTYAYAAGGRITTVTRPGPFTEVTEQYLDGQTKRVTGSAVVAQYFTYDVRSDGTRVSEVRTSREDSPAYERTLTDLLGRTLRVERPGFAGSTEIATSTYDARGQLARATTTGLAPNVFEYDELGNQIRSGLDLNGNGTLDVASMDRIQENETHYVSVAGQYWQQTTQRVYAADSGSTAKVTATTRSRLTGLSGGLVSEQVSIDMHGNETRSSVTIAPASATETRVTDVPDSAYDARTINAQGRLVSSTSTSGLTTTYTYDGLGRRSAVVDPRTGASETHYDAQGRVDYVRDAAGNTTQFGYDPTTGRKSRETNPAGKHSYFAYDARGQLIRTWGDVPYPVQYGYDNYGRRTEMQTYRTDAGWTSNTWPEGAVGDDTHWHYEEATGLLLSKEDAAGKAVTYTYGAAGRLATRTWARQKVGGGALRTTYGYDPATGELTSVDYNDTTPDVGYTYDRLGRQKTVTDGTGTRLFAYDPQTLQLQTETLPGPQPEVLTHYYDPTGVKGRLVGIGLGPTYLVGYGYGTTGQLASVSWTANGTSDVASYGRLPGSDLLAGYTTSSGFAAAYAYEAKRDLKTQVANRWNGAVASQYDYAYDAIGRRTSVKNSGGAFAAAAFTRWGYDERNQVTQSDRYLGTTLTNTGQPVNPEQRAFQYDPIGNRETSTAASAQTSYTPNELNQYDAVGSASPTYDDDGNLLNDGTKVLTNNAENQLVSVTVPGVSASTFAYDYIGRRVRKSVVLTSGTGYVVTWVYSGWNKIQEIKTVGSTVTTKNFVWGLDLSQSMEGAGGIGGLIAVVDGAGKSNLFAYDGNGNVSELINSSDGSIAAHYEYDAFGNTVLSSGRLASENCYRFSTKEQDDESGLNYYGYRYLDTGKGRWANRDPIGEDGGINLYGFVNNSPVDQADYVGLYSLSDIRKELMAWCSRMHRGPQGALMCLSMMPTRQAIFDRWHELEKQRGQWWASLPKCPRKLCTARKICQNPDKNKWKDPGPINKPLVERFHPGAVFEMRGLPFGGHSNQCTYDKDGTVIQTPPAMGTVDSVAPGLGLGHWQNDVDTVIEAASLDGKWSAAAMDSPAFVGSLRGKIGQWTDNTVFDAKDAGRITGIGSNLLKYFEVRPSWTE